MTPRDPDIRPLVAGGQGRTPGEVVFGAGVVLGCAAVVLVIYVGCALGVL